MYTFLALTISNKPKGEIASRGKYNNKVPTKQNR